MIKLKAKEVVKMKNILIDEYINNLKSTSPTPGGGSANCYIAKFSIALALKSFNVSTNRKSFKTYDQDVQEETIKTIKELESSLMIYGGLSQRDENAFDNFMKAYKSKDESAILEATKECFNSPYDLYKRLEQDIKLIINLKDIVVSTILSDYKMSLSIMKSVLESNLFNLKINAALLDENYQRKYDDIVILTNELIAKINLVIEEI